MYRVSTAEGIPNKSSPSSLTGSLDIMQHNDGIKLQYIRTNSVSSSSGERVKVERHLTA